jgi:DnaK suppressor protein
MSATTNDVPTTLKFPTPIEEIEVRLHAERLGLGPALASALRDLSVDADGKQAGDEADDDAIREDARRRVEELRARLRRIDEALERVADGSYGYCPECEEAIAPKRLAFDPAVSLCIGCQDAHERGLRAPTM